MIPKHIHYCWFGGNPLPELAKHCIASWRKFCPDYEITEWNEQNFDIEMNAYVKEAYENKKWAFVSDVARLYALVNYGGIYMDTDVEVVKPLEGLLQYEAVSGFESETQIPTGLMAAEANQKLFLELLHEYDEAHFLKPDGELDLTTNVTRITNICLKYGLVQNNQRQTLNGFTLLPKDYLCPKDYMTKEINLTDNTLCIHHFDGSWVSEEDKYIMGLTQRLKWLPKGAYFAKFYGISKYRGLKKAFQETKRWLRKK